jgi:hypothetical protein
LAKDILQQLVHEPAAATVRHQDVGILRDGQGAIQSKISWFHDLGLTYTMARRS